METKQAVQEVTGKWVDVVEEPFWVTLELKRVQGPQQPSSAFEMGMTLSRKQTMRFELIGLGAVITILGAAEK